MKIFRNDLYDEIDHLQKILSKKLNLKVSEMNI